MKHSPSQNPESEISTTNKFDDHFFVGWIAPVERLDFWMIPSSTVHRCHIICVHVIFLRSMAVIWKRVQKRAKQ